MGDAARQTCFVVMGFGEKTDYQSSPQRVLNLNRTFEDIIEPAVTAAGLECIRADRIIVKPDTSSEAETVGLWGAIHKRLWEVTEKLSSAATSWSLAMPS